jgi:hypothetical protein
MTRKCNQLLDVASGIALKSGLYRGSDLGIDYHDIVYGGERTPCTIKTIVKGKIRRCHRYAVLSVAGNKRFLALSVQPYQSGNSNQEIVRRLLPGAPTGFDNVLMDMYFCGTGVYDEIERNNRNFITPYKVNDTIDELYKESLLDGETVKPYRVRKDAGKSHWKRIYLHLVQDPEDEYHPYASNRKDLKIEEHYPLRWNEENLFKSKNCVKPVTSTTRDSFRLLLFTITLILASLWKLLVRSRQHMTIKRFKKKLLETIEEHTFTLSKADKTTAIA